MSTDDLVLGGGKVIAGAAIFIMFFTLLTIMSPTSYPMMDEEPSEPSIAEKIQNFLISFPNNFCIGGILIITSIFGSYYSKSPAVAGEVLRTLGPLQGYVFGFGILLIFWGFM